MKRKLQVFMWVALALLACTPYAMSQGVTTASISGTVFDETGDGLPGATVLAIHEPSGTRYGSITNAEGRFNLPAVRTGGPYTITVSFVGYNNQRLENLNLTLGQKFSINFDLELASTQLEEIMISDTRIFNSDQTGAATDLSNERINSMPTVSRNLNDFTRLTPQSNGTSFAGADNRLNNYTIDGNMYNNNFGLGTSQFAGGNPISLDAIEAVQVNIAPYDVRQGGFTGANVNAITKSGTNEFKGAIYTYFNNERFQGIKIGDVNLPFSETQRLIRGAYVGGPIIKDRLFFFASYETEESTVPGDNRLAARPDIGRLPDGQVVSRVPASRAEFVRQQMREIYGYETGNFENIPFSDEATRLNLRLDFNINDKNKLTLRYNRFAQFRDVTINGNSIRGLPADQRFTNTNRDGVEALTFRNGHYTNDNVVTSLVAELNSAIGTNMSNTLNIGFTDITDPRRGIPGGQTFPMIEVLEFDGSTPLYYMSMGNELFSVGNLLENRVFNITNNFSYFLGKHTLTAGLNFEYMTFDNAFNPTWNSWYRYNSYNNFVESVINRNPAIRPDGFAIGFTYDADNPTVLPTDRTAFGQVGIYFQDEYQYSRNLKLTLGLRVDMPFYPIDAPRNPRVEALGVSVENPRNPGQFIEPDVSQYPSVNPLFSPRFGFNWDALGDGTLQLRGGTGIFTGRPIFVHLSNQINANGVTRGFIGLMANQWGVGGNPQWQGFQSDVNFYRPDPSVQQPTISSGINLTDPDFRLPQTWRTNVAADYALPYGFKATLEGIYSRDYNSPFAANLASNPTGSSINIGGNAYPTYNQGIAGTPIREMFFLTNIDVGTYASITASIEKDWGMGIYTSLAYTRSRRRDFGLIGGSQAASLWPNAVQSDRNNPEDGYSRFDQPNRIVGLVSFNTKGLNELNNTTFSLFYDGGEQGRYSYTYSGNFGDGGGVRLMYVPESFEDAQLVDRVANGVLVQTAQEQWEILNQYIENNAYLSSMRGRVTERNGAKLPWLHRYDLRIIQDFHLTKDVNKHKLQLSFDIMNVGNLLNSEWGVARSVFQTNPMAYLGADSQGNARFNINTIQGSTDFPVTATQPIISLFQTWSAQVGVRYIFK
ncbi:MAG: TonB-dependent receptor [Cyclobacteriaceae bacterium]|nr:TonB-dependent receptor [Cyclobacteriaceae bacterium]